MAGYNYITGVGGPGLQQSGPVSPQIRAYDTTQQPLAAAPATSAPSTTATAPGTTSSQLNPLSTGALAPSNSTTDTYTPSTLSALQNNSAYVPGFGYINTGNLTSNAQAYGANNNGRSLNELDSGQFTTAQINAINAALSGQQVNSWAPNNQALFGGLRQNYGSVPQGAVGYGGNSGADNFGSYFNFGGQNYTSNQANAQTALTGFNNAISQYDKGNGQFIAQGNVLGQGGYNLPSGQNLNPTNGWNAPQATSLLGAEQYLNANPNLQYYNVGGQDIFQPYYSSPGYASQFSPQTYNNQAGQTGFITGQPTNQISQGGPQATATRIGV